MALITCPECGKEISDLANSCPNCGCPFTPLNQPNHSLNQSNQMFLKESEQSIEIDANNIIPITDVISQKLNGDSLPKKNKWKRKIILLTSSILFTVLLLISGIFIYDYYQTKERHQELYNEAIAYLENEDYQQAVTTFEELGTFEDAENQLVAANELLQKQQKYEEALSLFNNKEYQQAVTAFQELGDFKDSKEQASAAYGENFSFTFNKIYMNYAFSSKQCQILSINWQTAILEGKDINIALQEGLQSLQDQGLEIGDDKQLIDTQMTSLQNPTEDYEEAYKLLVEIYDLYNQSYNQALVPSGSLITYNSSIQLIDQNFQNACNKLSAIVPSIIEDMNLINSFG
ncbi:MAG: hypothetical protein UGF45_14175 [Massilioclostridium sp.]|nr:hypothetical protein [Massilioclostridium sp.]